MPKQSQRTIVVALRQNLALLQELSCRYEVGLAPHAGSSPGFPVRCPDDAGALLAVEMRDLAQEQFRVLFLDTRNRVLGQRLAYQGNTSGIKVRMNVGGDSASTAGTMSSKRL